MMPPPPKATAHPYQWIFYDKYRYLLLLIGFMVTTLLSINMSIINFTIICMAPPPPSSSENGTAALNDYHSTATLYSFSERDKAYLMWSAAIGTLIATLPFSALCSNYGARWPLFGAAVISAAATALIPAGAAMGMGVLMGLRVLQGITYSADFAGLGILTSRWAPLEEAGIFLSGIPALCSTSMGWPLVYYNFSFFSLLLALLWLLTYSDDPQLSACVSPVELEKIERDKTAQHLNTSGRKAIVPYGAILRTPLMWIIILNGFADLTSGIFIVMYQPQYFAYVLVYDLSQTGWMTAVSSLTHIPLKLMSGVASDRIRFLSERTKMIVCNTIAVGLPGVAYLGITYAPTPFIAFLWVVLNAIFFAPAAGGFYKCSVLTSRQYSHVVLAAIQINKVLALFISPTLMAIFVSDITDVHQWRPIFWIFTGICFVSAALFCWVATDKPASFTSINVKESMELKRASNSSTGSAEGSELGMRQRTA